MKSKGALARRWFARCCAAGVVVAVWAASGGAQEAGDDAPSLEFPNVWIGSNPIKLADLKGKAALLYFYEETCPRCKGRWPDILALAQKYADRPIAFIAVNSGTPLPLVMQYARTVGVSWPVIVDLDRSFEKACGVGEISLQNIAQVAYITAKGEVRRGSWTKLDDTIERALDGASWNIEPSEIPPELLPVWRSVEFAEYAPAAKALGKAKSSHKAEVKAAAGKLSDLVNERGREALDAAKAEAEKSKLRAYDLYGAVADRFAGYPAAGEASAARRQIAKDPAYRQELNAVKLVEKQRPLANSPKPAVRERATAAIKKIIDDQPGSEAARLGQTILDGQPVFEVK
ncbi:MAG: redoxin family protein [Pirellulales bacterium]